MRIVQIRALIRGIVQNNYYSENLNDLLCEKRRNRYFFKFNYHAMIYYITSFLSAELTNLMYVFQKLGVLIEDRGISV